MKPSGTLKVTTPSPRELRMTREFDAPRRLVWDCYTKPELIRRWMGGPFGWDLIECTSDTRVGGTWRRFMRGPNGEEMGFGGTFTEVVPHERLVTTEKYDQPWYEGDAECTLELSESGGKTTLTLTVRYASQEVRDAVMRTGASGGVEAGFDFMAAVLAELTGNAAKP
jgi:uncharacterized protein YndB with AHSA1/START domain